MRKRKLRQSPDLTPLPRKHGPTVAFFDRPAALNEVERDIGVKEHLLLARNPVVHVVHPAIYLNPRPPRHTPILIQLRHFVMPGTDGHRCVPAVKPGQGEDVRRIVGYDGGTGGVA